MPLSSFRIFKGENKSEDAVQRRRAQVRRAQRTYQERKNAYVKNLEDALLKSRTSETTIIRENRQLQDFLVSMQSHIPDHLLYEYTTLPLTARSTPSADLTLGNSFASSDASMSPPTGVSPNPQQQNEIPIFTLQIVSKLGSEPYRLGDFDAVAIGMEFVLFLERPCLGHIHGDPETPEASHGHAITATCQLLAVSGNGDVIPPPDPLAVYKTLPKDILANLLQLAPQVNIFSAAEIEDREVTPIQAWDWIQRQHQFKHFEVSHLKKLANEMAALAKCYGFGASVPAREFERIVQECLSL